MKIDEKHIKIAACLFLGIVVLYYISKKGGLKEVLPAAPAALANVVDAAAGAIMPVAGAIANTVEGAVSGAAS